MNRNTNAHFELAPHAEIERSSFHRDCSCKTSFNVGELIPIYVDADIMPGDTFDIEVSKVTRLQTLITPVMDNLYLDTYWFFVPHRLVWEHWRNLMGENTESAWIPETSYSVPYLTPPAKGWDTGTIADYFGLPIKNTIGHVNALPFRAYALICNEWFRDENLQDPIVVPTNDSGVIGSNGSNYITDLAKGGKPFIACKYHDYFTSALPSPLKGEELSLLSGIAPVIPNVVDAANIFGDAFLTEGELVPMQMQQLNNDGDFETAPQGNIAMNGLGQVVAGANSTSNRGSIVPTNLFARLDLADQLTINSLRQAFAIQRILEKDARSGTRYIELIRSHFGIESPDARLQRPEYLGGNRVPFNIEQVTQTSSTDSTSPLGSQAGWSQTNDYSNDVHKSFTEHGTLMCLVCARYDHSYQQGIERQWTRETRFDYYWPALAHIGEQAIKTNEIYSRGEIYKDKVFGYQEAWAEYRFKPNYVTGEMRSNIPNSLDVWHFADDYDSLPMLSAEWIVEDKSNVDRVLAVNSSVSNQIFGDFFFNVTATRPMPLYSIPGLLDHF